MKTISLIIPVFNEDKYLERFLRQIESYPSQVSYIICDCGSTDNTLSILESYKGHPKIKVISENIPTPSIMKTLKLAKDYIQSDYCMIHPIDANCEIVLADITKVLSNNPDYVIFYKKYSPANLLLQIQEIFLNILRVKLLKNYVWTNCPVFKTTLFLEILTINDGFLEDVLSSDYLKKKYTPYIYKQAVSISSRRYLNDGHFTRFIGNALIMILFRLKLTPLKDLKKLYYKNEKN